MKEEKKKSRVLNCGQKFQVMSRLNEDFGSDKTADGTPDEVAARYSGIYGFDISPSTIKHMCDHLGIIYANRKGVRENGLDMIKLLAKIESLEQRIKVLEDRGIM